MRWTSRTKRTTDIIHYARKPHATMRKNITQRLFFVRLRSLSESKSVTEMQNGIEHDRACIASTDDRSRTDDDRSSPHSLVVQAGLQS